MAFLQGIAKFDKAGLKPTETHVSQLPFVEDHEPDLKIGAVGPGSDTARVLIGSQDAAHSRELLTEHAVTHILNVATGVANCFEGDGGLAYHTVGMLDVPEFSLAEPLRECLSFLADALAASPTHRILIHCNAGVSRSAIVAIALLMQRDGLSFAAALDRVRAARSCVRPNDGFVTQLKAMTL